MREERNIAIAYMDQQRFSDAAPIFQSLIKKDPADWSLHYMLGQCLRYMGDIPGAIRALSSAVELDSTRPSVYLALGIANQLTENYGAAIASLERAIELDRGFFIAYNSLGLTYRKIGDLEKALEWYAKAAEGLARVAVEEASKEYDLCYRDEMVDGKMTRVALPYLSEKASQILRSNPTYSILKNNMGVSLVGLGYKSEAKEQFMESIEFIPDGHEYPDPYRNIESLET